MKIFFLIVILFFSFLLIPKNVSAQEKQAGSSAVPVQRSEIKEDRRAKILKAYLTEKNSPLAANADAFVKNADKYNLDWKLLVAISAVESTYGQQIPNNSYNAWGWGIYGDHMILFGSWDEGIETISKGLREDYIDKWGAKDVYEIGKFYAASPTWAVRVDRFMQKIDEFAAKDPSSLSISL